MKTILKVALFVVAAALFTQCGWYFKFEPDPDDIVDIPDKVFLSVLVEMGIDKDGDGMISYGEAKLVDSLDVGFSSFEGTSLHIGQNIGCSGIGDIESLEGIAAFKNLRYLDCGCNQLSSLDVSENTALEYLNCCCNQIITIDVSGNCKLKDLICSYNNYEYLDVSKNKNLIYLDCSESMLTSLDVTHNPKLEHLDCSDYKIPELDVSNCPELKSLNCHNNLLKELDLSNNTQLMYLWLQQNQLTDLDISNNNKLTEIMINDMPDLSKVCVWVLPFPPPGVSLSKGSSPNVYFTMACNR